MMSKKNRTIKEETILILHNIRSNYNVGSIFRTADAVGISKIYLTGYTPAPKDRFGRDVGVISKTALGAEESVDWEKTKNVTKVITLLKKDKYKIIAVEQSNNSLDYKKIKVVGNKAFIFGNEVLGLSKSLLSKCDFVAEIPMRGEKESLNVSVAVGVALFRILNV